jgi:hypothetical protein
MLTYATTTIGLPFYEHHVADGKRHALYGSLDEIRVMLVECLDAARSLRGLAAPVIDLVADPISPVPDDLKTTVGYDVERTMSLLTAGWTDEEIGLARTVPCADEVLRNQFEPWYEFMDARMWGQVLAVLLDRFRLDDRAWRSLAFRLWLIRVLSYTTNQAAEGYDSAMAYLERTIEDYARG